MLENILTCKSIYIFIYLIVYTYALVSDAYLLVCDTYQVVSNAYRLSNGSFIQSKNPRHFLPVILPHRQLFSFHFKLIALQRVDFFDGHDIRFMNSDE